MRNACSGRFEPDVVEAINERRENLVYLPGVKLSRSIRATRDLDELDQCDALLIVTPAQHMRSVLENAPMRRKMLVLCVQGDRGDRPVCFFTETAGEVCPELPRSRFCPVRHLRTRWLAKCQPQSLSQRTIQRLPKRFASGSLSPTFRIYVSNDVAGAEIGGAVKNVLAIACGVVEGKALGQNARAALIARGFAEMTRFGLAYGAKRETLSGLSGLGDLVLTCSSTSSRNYSLGIGIGEGRPVSELLANRKTIAEGAFTAPVLARLSLEKGIDMPIVNAVDALIAGRADVDQVLDELLSRPPRAEGV